ncbi:MAG: DUF3822 family protein [Croceitalea sp.]|nr:DUF3822 family protein [Croceitalea sp.]
METGRPFMIERTTNNSDFIEPSKSYKKLSIQVSLNGLSFFILDTIGQKVLLTDSIAFKTEATPYSLLKALKNLVEQQNWSKNDFSEVVVTHTSNLFALVPKPLFDPSELANYLKFNTKILANDQLVYDELKNQEIVVVYVPYTNINNYIFELFGEFEFRHSSTAVLQVLFNQKTRSKKTCYAHVGKQLFELMVIDQKKLLFYNQFEYSTPEDFLYYVLFTYEQLKLDPQTVKLKLFGMVEEGDPVFTICHDYLKKVSVFEPKNAALELPGSDKDSIDLTLLSSL